MKKKLRRQLKRSTKVLRKALKQAGGPAGVASGAFVLGGLATAAALNPEVREHARALWGSARAMLSSTSGREEEDNPLLREHTH